MLSLFILRSLPGAGKSTLAQLLSGGNADNVCSADDFPGMYTWSDDGVLISFNGMKPHPEHGVQIRAGHFWCQEKARQLMSDGVNNVVIDNTNTQRKEFQPYLELAEEFGYRVTVISLFDGGCTDEELVSRNVHGVPLRGVQAMRERYEHNWKDGDKYFPEE
jgi:hypothetical protein